MKDRNTPALFYARFDSLVFGVFHISVLRVGENLKIWNTNDNKNTWCISLTEIVLCNKIFICNTNRYESEAKVDETLYIFV